MKELLRILLLLLAFSVLVWYLLPIVIFYVCILAIIVGVGSEIISQLLKK